MPLLLLANLIVRRIAGFSCGLLWETNTPGILGRKDLRHGIRCFKIIARIVYSRLKAEFSVMKLRPTQDYYIFHHLNSRKSRGYHRIVGLRNAAL